MLLVEAERRTVADRRRLSFAGVVSVALAITDKGELVGDPAVDLLGIPERDRDGGSMHETVARCRAGNASRSCRADGAAIPMRSRKRYAGRSGLPLPQRWGKKPMCHVHVLTV